MNNKAKMMKGDMTVGNPVSQMLIFAIPMIIGNLFQQLYTMADAILVGKMIDRYALAAVGASNAITMLFVMIAVGSGIGCSVVISQLFGSHRISEMKTAITTALITVFGVAIVLSVIGRVMSRMILQWMNTPDTVIGSAEIYLNIYFYGFVFLFLYNMTNAIFNALGASHIPLIFLICSSLLNIGLDILMIRQMGIAGAAWATFISQALSAICSLFVLMLKLRKLEGKETQMYDWSLMKTMITVAIPSIIQQSLVSIGMLLIQAAVNGIGDVFMAGYTAAMRIDGLAIVPLVNIGNAVSTFVAQNMGARKTERIGKGFHIGLVMAVVIGASIWLLLFFCGYDFVAMFMDHSTDVESIRIGAEYLQYVSIFYFLFGIMNVTGAVLRGAGDMRWFMAQTFVNLFVRVVIVYSFVQLVGGIILVIALPISWAVSFTISFGRYQSGKWQKKQLI